MQANHSLSSWAKLCYGVQCFFFALLTLSLVACGGGGGGDDGTDGDGSGNTNLLINAGPDATVTEGVSYTLSAEVSGGDGNYTYNWTSSPTVAITQDDTSSSTASFTAPSVNASTEYRFTVSVNDNSGKSATDFTIITVAPVNIAPVASVTVPSYSNLPANTFPGGVEVIFDGSGSSDADSANGIADYSWSQTSGTNVITGVDTNLSTLTITTPIANDPQTLSFELQVTDTEGATDTETVTISIQSETETLPVVDAGFSQGVFSGEVVILNGTASTSIPSAMPLVYSWERSNNVPSSTASNAIRAIDDDDALSTFAVAPAVDSATVVAYTLTVTDANGNSVEDTINVRIRPMPTPLMNDTGFLQQATNNALTSVQQNDFPGQDGQRGADIIEQNGLIEKAGRGKAGFDFTRLNANGDEQDASAATWSCVRDNVTGLVWEVKTDDGTFQDKDFTYSWFSDEVNGGFEGDQTGANATCLLAECNTSAYVEAMNAQGLCGFFDWRMPTHKELFSLMHLGIANDVAIDEDYFPNTGQVSTTPLWYWTSVPSADGVNSDDAQNAWALDFDSGVDNFLNKSTAGRVRLVRAGR
ncbi:hypothetical protein MTsDn1_15620 [Alteromonas sp. MTD1]|uniref:Lcl C-terminal domain-containing protein n=1 Tax=Alteromonas sp. MTD1 TaxID=3057962 RepID=UPI0036F22029